jgi:hypothetical protein
MPNMPLDVTDPEYWNQKKKNTKIGAAPTSAPIGVPSEGGMTYKAPVDAPMATGASTPSSNMASAYQAQVEKQAAAQEKAVSMANMTPMERESRMRQERMEGDAQAANQRFAQDAGAQSRMNLEKGYQRVGGEVSGARQDAIDAQKQKMVDSAYNMRKKKKDEMVA